MTRKEKIKMLGLIFLLFMITIFYPKSLEIKHQKPDLVLLFTIWIIFYTNRKRAFALTILVWGIRDLIDYRVIGCYLIIGVLIFVLVDIIRQYFYQPGLGVMVFSIVLSTIALDVLYILITDIAIMLVRGDSVPFLFVENFKLSTWIMIIFNSVFFIIFFYIRKWTQGASKNA